jgi:8-oxo-dGTP pyrophosphatase MutT (NUDIX family)
LRETKEEASIDANNLDIHKDYKHIQSYSTDQGPKTVWYWLARLKTCEVKLSSEHQNLQWLPLEPAIKLAKYPEMEKMLREAEDYLKSKGGSDS